MKIFFEQAVLLDLLKMGALYVREASEVSRLRGEKGQLGADQALPVLSVEVDIGFIIFVQNDLCRLISPQPETDKGILNALLLDFDVERISGGKGRADQLTKEERTDITIAFCEAVRAIFVLSSTICCNASISFFI